MSKLIFLKYFIAYLAMVALVCYLHMLIFGKESTITALLKFVILGSTIGLYILVGALLCFAVHEIVIGSKEEFDSEKPQEKVTLDDVIVSDELKKDLKIICNNVSEGEEKMLKKLNCKPPKGYIFYGPPGTGKTLLASAIAGETNSNFINISGSYLLGSYFGQGVARVKNLFAEAKKKAPCIIFIDEIDSVGAKRSNSDSNINKTTAMAYNQILNQLLTEMDGFNSNHKNKGIVVIAATNRLDILDPALLRPGRFDKKIEIPLPDVSLRKKILDLYTKGLSLSSDLNLEEVAAQTEGFSGADLAHLVNEVKRHVVERAEEATAGELTITMDDFNSVLEKLKSERQKPENEQPETYHEINSLLQSVINCVQSIHSNESPLAQNT